MSQIQHDVESLATPADFNQFWQSTLEEVRRYPLDIVHDTRRALNYHDFRVEVLSYTGFGGGRVFGWLAIPPEAKQQRCGAILWLPGYGLVTPAIDAVTTVPGYITLAINVHNFTPDYLPPDFDPRFDGYMVRGIESPETYRYRAIVANCVRAIDVLAELPEADPNRLSVLGISQGGGLTFITAGLDHRIRCAVSDIAYLCDLPLALHLSDAYPFQEVNDYLRGRPDMHDTVMRTYAYFDPINHAPNIRCPILVSAGTNDNVCPLPTIQAVYDRIPATKEWISYDISHGVIAEMNESYRRWLGMYARE